MKTLRNWSTGLVAVSLLTATAAFPAQAQQTTAPPMSSNTTGMTIPKLPTNVVVFPAVVTGADGSVAPATPATREATQIVTEELRRALEKGGVGVVVYSSRLSSVQRAVNEGQGISADTAAKGPGDDPRVAMRLAEIIGAEEYLTVTIDNYVYDAKARRATFNLSIERKAANGANVSTSAEKAVGEAPEDVSRPLQEGSAVARAAAVVAEQSVKAVYPQSVAVYNPPKTETKKKKRSQLGWLLPVITLGGLLAIPR